MTLVCLILLTAAALLVPTARAQEFLDPERLISRRQFYSRPPGIVALLPQVRVSDDAKFAGQWEVFVESGRYEISQGGSYCFVVNHRDPGKVGRSSYVAIGALSVLRPRTRPLRPISMFRNQGWSRGGDQAYVCENDLPKHVPLTLETFARAHEQRRLDENDRLLTHRWHGHHDDGNSWADRDIWASVASADTNLTASLAPSQEQPDLRFDAKLLQFSFTQKRNSNQPVAFCLEGNRRIATVLTIFSPTSVRPRDGSSWCSGNALPSQPSP